jgi:hypothetical protein
MQYVSLRKAPRPKATQNVQLADNSPNHFGSGLLPAFDAPEQVAADLGRLPRLPHVLGGQDLVSTSMDPHNSRKHSLSGSDRDFQDQIHRLDHDEHQPLSCLGPHSLKHQPETKNSAGVHTTQQMHSYDRDTVWNTHLAIFHPYPVVWRRARNHRSCISQ